jgi:hypothetical protein
LPISGIELIKEHDMNISKIDKWLSEKNIILGESFSSALRNYAKEYKKKTFIYTG